MSIMSSAALSRPSATGDVFTRVPQRIATRIPRTAASKGMTEMTNSLPAPHPRPWIEQDLEWKSLHLSSTEIQSRMRLRHPDHLDLEYTRMMMAALLFHPAPPKVALVGLGGGSLLKFCHRHLPRSQLLVIEINPHVIALRREFLVPDDDARLSVLQADAAEVIAQTHQRFDLLMVDAFGAEGMPAALGTERFYADAHDVLTPGGVMVANLHAAHPHCPIYVERIGRCFSGRAALWFDSERTNCVAFARKGRALREFGLNPNRRPKPFATEAWIQLQPMFLELAAVLAQDGGDPA